MGTKNSSIHIEGQAIWPIFCKRYFQIYFLSENCHIFNSGFNYIQHYQHCIGLGNGLAPNRRQAITWSNIDKSPLRHMAFLGHNELSQQRLVGILLQLKVENSAISLPSMFVIL